MGNYTGLSFEAKLSNNGIKLIEQLHSPIKENVRDRWKAAITKCELNNIKLPFIDDVKKYSKCTRSQFIPFGVVCYVTDTIGEQKSVLDGDIWKVNCSLKNHGTLESFFALILVNITTKLEKCITHFEYYEKPRKWSLEELHQVKSGQITSHGTGEYYF